MMQAALLFAIFFPLLFSPLFFVLRLVIPRHLGFAALFFPLICFLSILYAGSQSGWNEPQIRTVPWIPSLGINFTLITDGLSLFFGILVTLIGVLTCWYAQYYMDPKDPNLARFYACLVFFVGTILGTVFVTNMMVFFFFWELTAVVSFLLIGYWHTEPGAWKGARMALLVTSFTGGALFAGIIMLNILTGTFEWHLMAVQELAFQEHAEWTYPIIICFLTAIFSRAAQFPFYFWLPNAMVAPAPVSAYLHAATMVNLGLFLTARMYPLFSSHEIWYYGLTTFSSISILLGAVLSLFSNDLKAILAYATISQLGFFLAFYGIGGEEGVEYDFVHILNHSLYKGSLYMLVGTIHHATGIRDIRLLGGLWKKLPLTAFAFFMAAAAMAGIPGTTGFLSKELILTDIIALGRSQPGAWIGLGILITASLFKVAIAIRLFYHLFVRDPLHVYEIDVAHPPSLGIQLPPLILSAITFIFGLLPSNLAHLTSYFYVSGLHKIDPRALQVWHGWTVELSISFAIMLGGGLIFYLAEKNDWSWTSVVDKLNMGDLFERFVLFLPRVSARIVSFFDPVSYRSQLGFLFALFGFVLGPFLIYYAIIEAISYRMTLFSDPKQIIVLCIGLFSLLVFAFDQLLYKLLAVSTCGLLIAVYVALSGALSVALLQGAAEFAIVSLLLVLRDRTFLSFNEWRGKTKRVYAINPYPTIKWSVERARSFIVKYPILPIAISIASGITAALILALYQNGSSPVGAFFDLTRSLDALVVAIVLMAVMMAAIELLPFRLTLKPESVQNKNKISKLIQASASFFILLSFLSIYLVEPRYHYLEWGFIAGLASATFIRMLGVTVQVVEVFPHFLRLAFLSLGAMLIAVFIPAVLSHWLSFLLSLSVYFIVLIAALKIHTLIQNACRES